MTRNGVDRSTLDPRADLSKLDQRNVAALVPMAREAKRRGYTARDFAEELSALWLAQATHDRAHKPALIVDGDLRAALSALSEIILAVYGERIHFTMDGGPQSHEH